MKCEACAETPEPRPELPPQAPNSETGYPPAVYLPASLFVNLLISTSAHDWCLFVFSRISSEAKYGPTWTSILHTPVQKDRTSWTSSSSNISILELHTAWFPALWVSQELAARKKHLHEHTWAQQLAQKH